MINYSRYFNSWLVFHRLRYQAKKKIRQVFNDLEKIPLKFLTFLFCQALAIISPHNFFSYVAITVTLIWNSFEITSNLPIIQEEEIAIGEARVKMEMKTVLVLCLAFTMGKAISLGRFQHRSVRTHTKANLDCNYQIIVLFDRSL